MEAPYVCHQKVRYAKANVYDQMITSCPVVHEKFHNWLMTELFGEWSDHFHLEFYGKTKKPYIRISDLATIPANVLYNFCIASRIPLEFPKTTQFWEEMVSVRGLHPGFALAICRMHIEKGALANNETNWNHWPIDTTCSLYPLTTYKVDPNTLTEMFKAHPTQVTPTNRIWGNKADLRGLNFKNAEAVDEFWLKWKEEHEDILLAQG